MFVLSNPEREKLAAWLRQEAVTNRYVVEQLDIVVSLAAMKILRDKMKAVADAEELIAGVLENAESNSI